MFFVNNSIISIFFSPTCSYLHPPKTWIDCDIESQELLTICLKSISGLNKVKLVDARFVWTEPHSRRIIVRLTIQKEAFGAILQQQMDVTFVVKTRLCDRCTKETTEQTWNSVVQIRQKAAHKRTFMYLAQQILKHNAQKHANQIQVWPPFLINLIFEIIYIITFYLFFYIFLFYFFNIGISRWNRFLLCIEESGHSVHSLYSGFNSFSVCFYKCYLYIKFNFLLFIIPSYLNNIHSLFISLSLSFFFHFISIVNKTIYHIEIITPHLLLILM